MELDVTTSELLAVLQAAADSKEEGEDNFIGITRVELQAQLGCGAPRALKHLKAGIEQGLIEPVYLQRRNMHKELTMVKGYDLTAANKTV